MKFGAIPLDEAEGAVLAHSLRLPTLTLKKGRVLSPDDIDGLASAGRTEVTAALLEPGDVPENEAAATTAAACIGDNVTAAEPFTGRVNLFAACRGIAVIDRLQIDRLNLIDESITIATVEPFALVEARQMLATVKVIPFAAPRSVIDAWTAAAKGALRVAPLVPQRVGLIQSRLEGMKDSVLDRTAAVTATRIAGLEGKLVGERRVAHETAAVAAAIGGLAAEGCDIVLVSGSSAIVDRRDVIPAAIVAAGGSIIHFGMPVDPGNLLLLGRLGETTVLGLPGCARSPKLNGFDWILQRLAARLPVGREDVMRLGAGGLLADIPARPLPRAEAVLPRPAPARAPRVAAVILAAGQSRRMGERNKLLIEVAGKPMVAHAVDAALRSRAEHVITVTGFEAEQIARALGPRPVKRVHNADHLEGMASSIVAGIRALADTDVDGAVIVLGDMPEVTAAELDRLIAAFDPAEGRAIIVPTRDGRRGNPVLWARRFFGDLATLKGDIGARTLLDGYGEWIAEVEMPDDSVLIDIDTPEALAAFSNRR